MKKVLGIGVIALAVLVSIGTTLALAQQKQSAADRERVEREKTMERQSADRDFHFEFEREVQGHDGPHPGMPGDFVFIANEMNFGGKVVKGAPYSAQAITESVQNLSDGNRIVNKSTAALYRDSEGRTRREQSLRAIGSFANGGEALQTVFISDPVAGTSYTLDPRTRVARQMPPMNFTFQFKVPAPAGQGSGEGEGRGGVVSGGAGVGAGMGAGVMRQGPTRERIEAGQIEIERAKVREMGAPDTRFLWGWRNQEAKDEALGKQNVEGVEAEGTRSTVTIPAGEIGNERAIEIVNERWYSAELQTLVMTRHTDPRFGETTYRLTNIDRSEPARSLFEVPADYTLKPIGGLRRKEEGVSATSSGMGVIAGGVLNGKATNLPLPAYSPVAKAARATGNVTVEVTIDEGGNVVAAKAVAGHPLLQAASVEAARNAKFTPTKLSGDATKVKGVLVYTFSGE